jgi:hypothetical protein
MPPNAVAMVAPRVAIMSYKTPILQSLAAAVMSAACALTMPRVAAR